MIDFAKRLRGPALIAALVVVGFYVALALGYFGVLLNRGQSLTASAQMAGASSVSLVWVFAVVALALACVLVRPAVLKAHQLISAAAIAVSVATIVGFAFWLIGLFSGFTLGTTLAAIGGFIEIVAMAACGYVLWRIRGLGEEEQLRLASTGAAAGLEAGTPPVWNPQQAVGLQWTRAGDAATGALTSGQPARAAIEAPTPGSPDQPADQPSDPTAGQPPAEEPPAPPKRQTWSRGGIAPADLPWTTAEQAAQGQASGPAVPEQPSAQPRRTPDWTPAPRPEDPSI